MVLGVAEREKRGGGESSRPHALDIYERVCEDSKEELGRPFGSLFFSAIFAGFAIGLAPMAVAIATVLLGDSAADKFVAALLYPIGYVAVILGRSQFFTENTLHPVVVTMREHEYFRPTARLWAIVLPVNLLGALIFATLAVTTGAFDNTVQDQLVSFGVADTSGSFADTFWSAVVTGFLLALVAWLVESTSKAAGAQIFVIWVLTFLVALGTFDHCIATTVEAFAALLDGELGFGKLAGWLGVTILGNVAGGVLIVAAINYGQVREED